GLLPEARKAMGKAALARDLSGLIAKPHAYTDHPHLGALAKALIEQERQQASFQPRPEPAPYRVWGDDLEPGAVDQMKNAAQLPVAVRGALMPDAHQGYGLPIGGVLATDNAVIPYAVGVDIACRMRLSVYNASPSVLEQHRDLFRDVLQQQTCFGACAERSTPS